MAAEALDAAGDRVRAGASVVDPKRAGDRRHVAPASRRSAAAGSGVGVGAGVGVGDDVGREMSFALRGDRRLPNLRLARSGLPPPVGWPQQPTVYGSALFLITAVPIRLAGSDPIRALIALKLLTIIAHAGMAWLIYLIVRRLAPQRAVFALVAYGWWRWHER